MFIRKCPNCLSEIKYKIYKNYEKSEKLKRLCQKCTVNKYKKETLTKERCKEIASYYKTKKEFIEKHKTVYQKCLKNKWIDELCSHMIKLGNNYKRCIYCYEFTNNYVYIGLTYNIDKRHEAHRLNKDSSVYKFYTNNNIELPNIKQLTDYIDKEIASEKETEIKDNYINNGWNIINKNKTGGLGGTMIIWTKEKCIEASKNCKTRKEFIVKYPGAYRSSKKNNWLNDIYNNFSQLVNEKGFWTKEKCYNESLKFKTRKELKENCLACYSTIINNKWSKELFAHMEHYSGLKLKGYWNKENCLEASKRYKTKTSFRENEAGAYKASKKNGWLEEFFK